LPANNNSITNQTHSPGNDGTSRTILLLKDASSKVYCPEQTSKLLGGNISFHLKDIFNAMYLILLFMF